jgi:tyrosinase
MTLSVHFSGIFLAWHRNFVWLWEQALRNECNYAGYQPYVHISGLYDPEANG